MDLAGDLGRKTESSLSGFSKPSTDDVPFLHVHLRLRRDEESSLLARWETLVESVYHAMLRQFNSEFGDVLGRADAGAPGDEIVWESGYWTQ